MPVLNQFLSKVVTQIINPIIILIAAAAFVVFLWGVYNFISHAGEETERAEGKSAIFWGLVGLMIIFGVYGILNLTLNTFGVPTVTPGNLSAPR
jgi:TRAP-type C4-dicarboxylate transport system permease small subunit